MLIIKRQFFLNTLLIIHFLYFTLSLYFIDSVISTPSTPNSSLSSQTNLYGSPNTPSPATPTQQTTTPLGTTGVNQTSAGGTPSNHSGGPGSSGHKNSLKGTKLARRARSFKDDLFERISLMRATSNTLGRWVLVFKNWLFLYFKLHYCAIFF